MTTPTRSDYPRCETCGHGARIMPDGRIHCDAYAIWVPPEWGCIDHTDLDAPDDPRQVTGTAHGLPITEAADDGP